MLLPLLETLNRGEGGGSSEKERRPARFVITAVTVAEQPVGKEASWLQALREDSRAKKPARGTRTGCTHCYWPPLNRGHVTQG